MLDFLGALIGFCLPFAIVYYFMFGGKEKLATHLFNKMSLAGKVEKIIKRDLSAEYARATFYIINDYYHKMCQADWQKFCQERIDPSLDKSSPEYAEAVAPIMNAVVVNEGYYLRRGMEDMSRKLVRFMPGVNDMISLNYFVEPYKYSKSERLAAKSLAEESLRQKEFEERYERERPMREAREAERKAELQQRSQEQSARRKERAELFERQRQEQQAAKDARRRCSQCVHSGKCSMQNTPGSCGGFMPR